MYDVVIVGAGVGGYTAAINAAKAHKKVALIEKDMVGGTCLNRGCIPTKTYLSIAASLACKPDKKEIANSIKEKVEKLRSGLCATLNRYEIEMYSGEAEILDKNTILVRKNEKNFQIKTENIILATGSRPRKINIHGIESSNVITTDEMFFEENIVPESIVIIGGGVVGIEFSYLLNLLGCDVTIIENQDRILANISRELAETVEFYFRKSGIKIYKNTKIVRMDEEDDEIVISIETPDGKKQILTEKVLLAIGRKANIDMKGLSEIGVEIENERIKVNEFCQSSVDNIFAIGDVASGRQLAYIASLQAQGVIDFIVNCKKEKILDEEIPSCIYMHPEIAVIGIDEAEAKRRQINYKSSKFLMSANSKSVLEGNTLGYIKIIINRTTQTIIGAELFCEHAVDMIMIIETFMVNKIQLDDIIKMSFPHPSYAEAIKDAIILAL